ncbi:hypothetical protein C8J42_102354 [Sphingomonas sp. PP-CE-1A-559]|nr:hypothetical protein C8J42_102354 [Sphingomonas sp. PP-CE-1A-559]
MKACLTAAVILDWFDEYFSDRREACFPAKAGTQTGLPPSRENKSALPFRILSAQVVFTGGEPEMSLV